MDETFSHSLWRMDWGLGNPNKTAALITSIMIVVWALAYLRKWGFWLSLTLFTGFGVCIILTLSRGGLVGLIMGCLCVLAWAPRPFPTRRWVAVAIACLALVIFALVVNAPSRYSQGLITKDRSIDNRLLIWEQVPAMIHDAPNGWGFGESGEAYMQWYQPINRGEGYRTLVNSHLTWLVELNWWGRWAYIFFWLAILVLLWPNPDKRWYSIPLGIWVAFALCASFSSVAEVLLLWIIPIIALISVIVSRSRLALWPGVVPWLSAGIACIIILGGIFIGGNAASKNPSAYSPHDGVVILGTTNPTIWLVAPNRNVLGPHYGHEARRGYAPNDLFLQKGFGVAAQVKDVPADQTLVFSGQIPSGLDAFHPKQVILISPKPISKEALQALLTNPNLTVVVGEFSQNKGYWTQQSQQHPNLKIQLVTGSEEYIPDWMQEIARAIRS